MTTSTHIYFCTNDVNGEGNPDYHSSNYASHRGLIDFPLTGGRMDGHLHMREIVSGFLRC
jgi:hypothetical protein